jgi:transcriptional regulator
MQITTAILAAQPFLKGLIAQQLDTLMSNAMAVEFPADKSKEKSRWNLRLEKKMAMPA